MFADDNNSQAQVNFESDKNLVEKLGGRDLSRQNNINLFGPESSWSQGKNQDNLPYKHPFTNPAWRLKPSSSSKRINLVATND